MLIILLQISLRTIRMVCWLLKCEDGFPAHQLYCCLLLWIQLCSQYLHEVNSCYSTTGLCYSNIRSDSDAGGAGAGSQLWKLLCALVLQERSRKNLFMSYLGFNKCLFQDFFPFSLSKTYLNFEGKNSATTDQCCQTTQRVKFQCTNVSIVYYLWCSRCHTKVTHKVLKLCLLNQLYSGSRQTQVGTTPHLKTRTFLFLIHFLTAYSNIDFSEAKTLALKVKERRGIGGRWTQRGPAAQTLQRWIYSHRSRETEQEMDRRSRTHRLPHLCVKQRYTGSLTIGFFYLPCRRTYGLVNK